ncbi:Putative uncharacterized protein [Taphrina deformans PYCC 5710]|uniref:Uncharacterized protein n=1 Tax=Taphrina deformans (strain PYCC 5710 / ATCC 11124 / CBS 356.35 / IMI 108563 / JCM 9778 / NBRC 8474) TaxID=1097556 RepID=R4XH67_TAPDE|nr:Putative uncharacterized protein [Taphrina deformans PYCC 5710]|eukprot:CCG82731.1 Putative uncharacterized protein [Taphrina deformans PYCC 5710]
MSSLFKRKQQQTEPNLMDIDDNIQTTVASNTGKQYTTSSQIPSESSSAAGTATANKANFLKWPGSRKPELGLNPDPSRAQGPRSGHASPLDNTIASPRISTSSATSIFERSVDTIPTESSHGPLVDPSHSQLVIDNQIPSVLDASVEAITSNEDLDKVEIVTAQPSISENMSVPSLHNPWSEEENISTAQIAADTQGTAKRLSFVSYTDLLGVEQAEAEAVSSHSHKSGSPRPQSPATGIPGISPGPSRPTSTPSEGPARRQKSVVTMGQTADLELTRTTMADTILGPTQALESENPWA